MVQHTGSGSRQSRPGAAGSEQIAQRQLQVKQVRTGSRVLEDSLTISRQPQRVDCKINFPNGTDADADDHANPPAYAYAHSDPDAKAKAPDAPTIVSTRPQPTPT